MKVYSVCFLSMVLVLLVQLGTAKDDCKNVQCGKNSIEFPFRLRNVTQPDYCSYPGFDLSCASNQKTVIEWPNGFKFFIKNIDYNSQQIDVYSKDVCHLQMLQNLSVSAPSFQFRDVLDIPIFSCPTLVESPDLDRIACFSNSTYHVYAVKNLDSYGLLVHCTKDNEILPVPYNFNHEFFRLYWPEPACQSCEDHGQACRLKNNRKGNQTECYTIANRPSNVTGTGTGTGTGTRIIVATLSTVGFLITALAVFALFYINRREKEGQVKIEQFLKDYKALKPTRYTYADIKRMTDQFKDKLGQGAFGTVYKGKLTREILVAVKLLNNDIKGNGEEFINEVGTIGSIHHVNVVRLVGFCADGYRRALVYEFLPNESLDKYIFSANIGKHNPLCWEKLHDIALGVAKGIEYLHQGCNHRILHFDIKPHNILLNQNFIPKISDFGLAKLCSRDQSAISMTAARGTMGYIAPEVLSRNFGKVSYKSDVYSYGMLVLEMVGGRKNNDVRAQNSCQIYFPEWIYNHLERGEELHIRIEGDGDSEIAKKLSMIGLRCIQWYPSDRPSMKEVVQMLVGDINLTMPPNPFASASSASVNGNNHPNKATQQELPVILELE